MNSHEIAIKWILIAINGNLMVTIIEINVSLPCNPFQLQVNREHPPTTCDGFAYSLGVRSGHPAIFLSRSSCCLFLGGHPFLEPLISDEPRGVRGAEVANR